METIAAIADISPKTLYNYFGTKGQILLALISHSDDKLLRKRASPWAEGNPSTVDAVVNFFDELTRHSLIEIDRQTWRHAIAHTLINGVTDDIAADYHHINDRLVNFIANQLNRLRLAEAIAVATASEIDDLAVMLFDMHRVLFIRLITEDNFTQQDHLARLRRYISVTLRDFTAPSAL